MTNTPNLRALRAFEAAARLQSFTGAAEELSVTHGAISHQVKLLERQLGAPLFHRDGRGVRLSVQGERLAPRLRQSLLALDAVFDDKGNRSTTHRSISILGSFANCWLSPRLSKLRKAFPQTSFHFHVGHELVDLSMESIDASVRFGRGDWAGVDVDFLFPDYIVPVCSPGFAAAYEMRAAEDILNVPVINDTSQSWAPWFAQHGVKMNDDKALLTFSDSAAVVFSAKAGAGIALARLSLIADDLICGSLVAPFKHPLQTPYSYYFVRPATARADSCLGEIKEWFMQEGQALIKQALGRLTADSS